MGEEYLKTIFPREGLKKVLKAMMIFKKGITALHKSFKKAGNSVSNNCPERVPHWYGSKTFFAPLWGFNG
jgi:hypothetical protein